MSSILFRKGCYGRKTFYYDSAGFNTGQGVNHDEFFNAGKLGEYILGGRARIEQAHPRRHTPRCKLRKHRMSQGIITHELMTNPCYEDVCLAEIILCHSEQPLHRFNKQCGWTGFSRKASTGRYAPSVSGLNFICVSLPMAVSMRMGVFAYAPYSEPAAVLFRV